MVVEAFVFLVSHMSITWCGALRTGRCTICETERSMIVHPPSGGHSGDIKGLVDLCPDVVHDACKVGSNEAETCYEDNFLHSPFRTPIVWTDGHRFPGLPLTQAWMVVQLQAKAAGSVIVCARTVWTSGCQTKAAPYMKHLSRAADYFVFWGIVSMSPQPTIYHVK